jgi:L-iditol 2-dehydrogenase
MGVTDVVNIREQDPVEAIRTMTDGVGVDLAIETAGNGKALQSALAAVRRGGRISLVGLPPQSEVSLNVSFIVDNEIDIGGVFRYRNAYPLGIDILSAGGIDLNPIITDKMKLEDTHEAFQKAIHEKRSTVKIMIYP